MSDVAPRMPCPDAESLAAYVDGRTGVADRAAMERHLVECGECRDLIGAAAELAGESESAAAAPPRRRAVRWYVAGAGLVAAAAAIVIAVRLQQPSRELYVAEMADLVAAVGTSRPVEPRLTGGFAYGPPPSPTRGDARKPSLQLAGAAARLEKRAERGDPPSRAALGVAQVLLRDPEAPRTIEDACDDAPDDGRCRSDLAAAYLVVGRERNDGETLARALDAAERAVKSAPALQEAWFNRALACEYLGLTERARLAWDDYLRIDSSSEWAAEARRRRDALGARSKGETERFEADLLQAAREANTSRLDLLVAERPRESREYVETTLLAEWAAHVQGANSSAAGSALKSAERIAIALRQRTSDALTAETVQHIRRAAAAEAHLADGFLKYAAGRRASDAYEFEQAQSLLAAAGASLRRAGSPFVVAADFHATLPLYQQRKYDTVRPALDALDAEAERGGAAIIRAFVFWRRGLLSLVQAQYADALRDYNRALSLFEKSGEQDHVASVENAIAEALRFLGDVDQSWAYQLRALQRIQNGWNPPRRHPILLTAGLTALRNELPFAALAFHDELLANAQAWKEPAALTSAHLQRARSLSLLGRGADAEREIGLARAAHGRIGGPIFARQYADELLLAEGESLAPWKPAQAVQALDAADARLTGSGALLRRAHVLLARGRAKQRLGQTAGAHADFLAGIETFERRRTELPQEDLRISYFDQAWNLFDEMIRLLVANGQSAAALDFVERAHARDLLHADRPLANPLNTAEIQRRMPARTQILYYAVLDDRTYGWLVTPDSIHTFESGAGRRQLRRLVNRVHAVVRRGAGDADAQLDELYRHLLQPIASRLREGDTLAIVGDDPLYGVPFAALREPRTRERIVARHPIALTGSGSVFVGSRPQASEATHAVLAVGNPKLDYGEYPELADLPDAAAEAERVTQIYGSGTFLSGERATKTAVLAALDRSDIVHFAGHAVANPEFPWLSRFILAASADGSALFGHEIARRRLAARLVVLGACRSATGAFSRGEGPLSLARPFLMAGVPTVVGTLWDVPDRASRRLLERMHAHVRAGTPPAFALRDAQLELMKSSDPELNAVAAWAGFVTVSGPSTGRDHRDTVARRAPATH